MIGTLFADSLQVWQLPGSVAEQDRIVTIRTEAGVTVTVAAVPAAGHPFRWRVQRADGPPRDCLSIAGALSAVREALEVPGGPALRIAPGRGGG